MRIEDLKVKLAKDPEYRLAYAEEDAIARVAIHVLRIRHDLGLKQAELAERIGKDQAWVSHLEAGDENITLRTLAQLAFALERDVAELLAPVTEPAPATS